MGRSRRPVTECIDALPHWARVAFAARCARRVLPLFERSWPGVPPRRVATLAAALEAAERSAAEARPVATLDDAADATKAAGAAQMGIHHFRNDEHAPTDPHAATTACSVAKAVEWAVRAAITAPAGSPHPTLEAFMFTHDAAHAAEEVEIIEGLHADLEGLSRVADRGRWADQTAVPPSAFGLLSRSSEASEPWWKIW